MDGPYVKKTCVFFDLQFDRDLKKSKFFPSTSAGVSNSSCLTLSTSTN